MTLGVAQMRVNSFGNSGKLLGDLYRVRRGAFSDLIAADEQVDASAILARNVLADSSDQHIVLA